MRLSRSLTSQICRVLIGVLLYAQLAVSAYACPGFASTPMSASSTTQKAMAMATQGQAAEPGQSGSGCDQMDAAAPNLCTAHCHAGHQTSDTGPSPVVDVPTPGLLYVLPDQDELAPGSSPSLPATDPLLASAPPSHAILHCVLRI